MSAWYLIFLRFFKHRFVSRPKDTSAEDIQHESEPFLLSDGSRNLSRGSPGPTSIEEASLPRQVIETPEYDLQFSEKSLIVTVSQIKELCQHLPKAVMVSQWTLRYSLRRDGTSLDTLLELSALTDRAGRPVHSSYVILIEDSWGYIFGNVKKNNMLPFYVA